MTFIAVSDFAGFTANVAAGCALGASKFVCIPDPFHPIAAKDLAPPGSDGRAPCAC